MYVLARMLSKLFKLSYERDYCVFINCIYKITKNCVIHLYHK